MQVLEFAANQVSTESNKTFQSYSKFETCLEEMQPVALEKIGSNT